MLYLHTTSYGRYSKGLCYSKLSQLSKLRIDRCHVFKLLSSALLRMDQSEGRKQQHIYILSEWNKYILTIVFSNAGSINIPDHFYQI